MPDAWVTVPLGQIADISISGVDKHILPGEAHVRLCNYLDVYRNRRLTQPMRFSAGSATRGEILRFQIQKGDVLITKDSETPDDIGIPALVVDDMPNTVCGYHLALIRPRDRLVPSFLLHHLQAEGAKRHFLQTASGLTRFGLGIRAIASLPVALPAAEEQAAIARILDAVDAAIERTREAVERARTLRASLLRNLLALGVGDDGHIRDRDVAGAFVVTPLGWLPSAWRMSTVGREFDLQTGFTLNADRRPVHRKRRYLRVANVHRDALRLDDIAELEAGDAEFAERILRPDDLLVVEGHADRRQIGRCARVTVEAAGLTFQNHLFRLRSSGDVLPSFACLWLNSMYAQRYWNSRCATSSGLNTINQQMLKRMVMPVPSAAEQQAIATLIAAQRTHLEALTMKEDRLTVLKKSLLHDLLTGKVRVPVMASQEPELVALR